MIKWHNKDTYLMNSEDFYLDKTYRDPYGTIQEWNILYSNLYW